MTRRSSGVVASCFLMMVAISCAAPAYQKSLAISLKALDASAAGFATYDHDHQQAIVLKATSLEDGQTKLAAYRAKKETVVTGMIAAYSGLALAAVSPSLEHMAEVAFDLKALYDAIQKLRAEGP